MKKFLIGILLLLCSCEEIAQDGVVSEVKKEIYNLNGFRYRVQVTRFKRNQEMYGGSYYYFWTNDTLMVGDTIHIGKVK